MKVTAGQHGKWHLDMLTEPPISPSQKPPLTLAPRTPHSTVPPPQTLGPGDKSADQKHLFPTKTPMQALPSLAI